MKATVEETEEKTKKLVVPAAVLYYNIDDPMVETMKQDQEQINNEIFKQLRMEGLVNEDDPVLPALDRIVLKAKKAHCLWMSVPMLYRLQPIRRDS